MQSTERPQGWNGVERAVRSVPHCHQPVPAQRLSVWQRSPREEREASPRGLGSSLALHSTSPG